MSEKKDNLVPLNRKERRAQKAIEKKLEPAPAETTRKVDMTQQVINIEDGEPVTIDGRTPATLRTICMTSLSATLKDDLDTRAAKAPRYYLAKKIAKGRHAELTQAEVTFLTERIGKAIQQAFIVEAACLMLEGETP